MVQLVDVIQSSDGSSRFILKNTDSEQFEAVFFRQDNKTTSEYNYSLCISSQAGCALNCAFCATGTLGLKKNLQAAELLEQVNIVRKYLIDTNNVRDSDKFHVALMGMGEPLHNFDNIKKFYILALKTLPHAEKISLSTVGLVPEILSLAHCEAVNYDLFISLHTPYNKQRNALIPINKKYSIEKLLVAATEYANYKKIFVKVSYLLLKGVNDSPAHARDLTKLLNKNFFKVQLLMYNYNKSLPFLRAEKETADAFNEVLISSGLDSHVIYSRGVDINAGCGQLICEKAQFK